MKPKNPTSYNIQIAIIGHAHAHKAHISHSPPSRERGYSGGVRRTFGRRRSGLGGRREGGGGGRRRGGVGRRRERGREGVEDLEGGGGELEGDT